LKVFKDYISDIEESCDVCVIGSGPGGAVAAKELAEKGYSVILLEEGGHYTKEDWNSKPVDGLLNLYRDAGTTGTLGNPFISLTLGRCIGGSSTVNSATCFRTPDAVFKSWNRDLGLDNITPEAMNSYYEDVEKTINVTELPWEVLGQNAMVVKRGCDKLGLNCRPLKHNVKDCHGCGPCQLGCPDGAKQSMDVTYVPLAEKHGARIYANCRAEKIIIKNKKVRGVKASVVEPKTDRVVYNVKINARFVVVSCGALITPSLLKRSGVKNRNLGKHLQIHPGGRVVALMNEKVEGWKGVSQGVYVDDFEDEGIMLEGVFIHPSLMLSAIPGIAGEHKELALKYNNLAAFGVMAHDETTGRVHRGLSPGIFNRVYATYFIKKRDTDKLKRGIAYMAKIFFAAGAERVYTAISKKPVLHSFEDADELLKMSVKPNQIETMAFHPLGSCRMAADRKLGAVDKYGESFDVENLYVADGSIIPTSLGVNPQLTIMALSAYVAEAISKKISR